MNKQKLDVAPFTDPLIDLSKHLRSPAILVIFFDYTFLTSFQIDIKFLMEFRI